MRINGLLAAAWQLLQPLVSSSKAAANLVLLFALTAFSTSSIRGSMMVLIISATGKPSKVGKSLAASSSVLTLNCPVITHAASTLSRAARARLIFSRIAAPSAFQV